MKILVISQVYSPDPSGIFVADLVRWWERQGHDVRVWTAERRNYLAPERLERPFPFAYDRSSMSGRIASQLGFSAACAARLATRSMFDAPDLLVWGGPPTWAGAMMALVPRLSSPRVLHWVLDLHPEVFQALSPWPTMSRVACAPMKVALDTAWARATAVVTISPAMARNIRARTPAARVRTIPLWAPIGVTERADRGLLMRRERGVASDAFVALYQGSLGLAYDFDPLLDSARHLASDPSIIVVIVGTGTQRAHIERRVRSEHLTNVRMFDPNSPDSLSDSLAMGDVHLVSSRAGWNGVSFPSKVISALACGRPVGVIGPRDSEIATMVCEKRCGFVALDGPALADGIKRLKADATEVSRQRRVARATYESRFDREGALVQWDRLLLSMFADGRLAGLVDHGTDWNDTTERVESQ